MVYEWKPGSRYKTDANTAGAVCEQLEAAGNLSAKSLLDVSRPADAPLHSEFEWDDSIAAEKFREDQARCMIRHLVVRLDSQPQELVRSFFKIEAREEAPESYTRIETVLKKPDMRAELLKQALAELETFQRKYSTLSELASVFNEAAKVRRTVFQHHEAERSTVQ